MHHYERAAVGGLLGIGGGLVAVPLVSTLYGMSQHDAQGTALVMIVPNLVVSVLKHRAREPIELKLTAFMVAPVLMTAALGSTLALAMNSGLLRAMFAVLLLGLTAAMLFGRTHEQPGSARQR